MEFQLLCIALTAAMWAALPVALGALSLAAAIRRRRLGDDILWEHPDRLTAHSSTEVFDACGRARGALRGGGAVPAFPQPSAPEVDHACASAVRASGEGVAV